MLALTASASASAATAGVKVTIREPAIKTDSQVTTTSVNQRSNTRSLLSKARRLDQGNNDDGNGADREASVEQYLENYSLKMRRCIDGEEMQDANGNTQYGVVIFRMCHSNSCDSGCNDDYAEFAISIADFVAYYWEDQADNMGWEDDNPNGGGYGMDMDNIAGCNAYESDEGANGYYTGPMCTSDGKGIQLGVFDDAYCKEPSSVDFSQISNGWTLPFADGGLVSTSCTNCAQVDDNGDLELREMCGNLYATTSYRCETNWNAPHYYWDHVTEIYRYGQDTLGCNYITRLEKSLEPPVDETFAIIMLILVVGASVGGFYYYTQWWNNRKYHTITQFGDGCALCRFASQIQSRKKVCRYNYSYFIHTMCSNFIPFSLQKKLR